MGASFKLLCSALLLFCGSTVGPRYVHQQKISFAAFYYYNVAVEKRNITFVDHRQWILQFLFMVEFTYSGVLLYHTVLLLLLLVAEVAQLVSLRWGKGGEWGVVK